MTSMNHSNTDVNISTIAKTLSEVDDIVQNKMKCDRDTLVHLADDMAESATTFKGQGYSTFLKSRDKFVSALDTINKEYQELLKVMHK